MQDSSLKTGSSVEQHAFSNGAQKLKVIVGGDEGSLRLDRVLAVRNPELSRSRLKTLILAGQVSLAKTAEDATPVRDPAYHVAPGDTITIDVPAAGRRRTRG